MQGVAIKDMTGPQLRDAAKQLGLTGVSKLKVDALREKVRVTFQSAPLPLSRQARIRGYAAQNSGSGKLTPKQRRRADKKERANAR